MVHFCDVHEGSLLVVQQTWNPAHLSTPYAPTRLWVLDVLSDIGKALAQAPLHAFVLFACMHGS